MLIIKVINSNVLFIVIDSNVIIKVINSNVLFIVIDGNVIIKVIELIEIWIWWI